MTFDDDRSGKAKTLADTGRLDEAIIWAEMAVDEEKMNPRSHFILGTILRVQGRIKEAEEEFEKTVYLDQRHVQAHFALGSLHRQLGKRQKSYQHFQQALALLTMLPADEVQTESEMTNRRMVEIIKSMI